METIVGVASANIDLEQQEFCAIAAVDSSTKNIAISLFIVLKIELVI